MEIGTDAFDEDYNPAASTSLKVYSRHPSLLKPTTSSYCDCSILTDASYLLSAKSSYHVLNISLSTIMIGRDRSYERDVHYFRYVQQTSRERS